MKLLKPLVRFTSVRRFVLSPISKAFFAFRSTVSLWTPIILILVFLSILGRASENSEVPSSPSVSTISPTPPPTTAFPFDSTSASPSASVKVDSAPDAVRAHLSDPWFDALVSVPRPQPGEFPPSAAHSQLLTLSWLVGCWELKTNDLVFQTKIDWAPGGAYLVCRDFVRPFAPGDAPSLRSNSTAKGSSAPGASPSFAALRIIGWNPISELFQTSIFCRDGSSGSAVWQASGDDVWIVSTRILLANGRAAASVDFIRPRTSGGFIWESRSRTIENTRFRILGRRKRAPFRRVFLGEIEPSPLPESPDAATAK